MELDAQDSYYALNKPTLQSVGVGQTPNASHHKLDQS